MRDMQQGDAWGNIRPLREVDGKLGAALIEFGRMIENGRAYSQRGSRMTRSGLPPLTHPLNEYPSNNSRLAKISLERALRQHVKGNITDADLAEIIARCRLVIE